jgi:hypothetical protein
MSYISVIYFIFHVVTFNVSILIHTRCKEPTFERLSITMKTKSNVNWKRRQKVKHCPFTCSCAYHPHKNTSMYEQHLTRSLSEYDALIQNDCHGEINVLKFVRLARHTFRLVFWLKTAAHHARHHGWLYPSLPVSIRDGAKQRWRGYCHQGNDWRKWWNLPFVKARDRFIFELFNAIVPTVLQRIQWNGEKVNECHVISWSRWSWPSWRHCACIACKYRIKPRTTVN